MIKNGGSSFPVHPGVSNQSFCGMTLRDYFAAKAMQGIVFNLSHGIRPEDVYKLAEDSYVIADAMLKTREK